MKWTNPRTITGPPAEDELYLRRDYINDDFWDFIGNGSHILFTAPRRVGKSSIMRDLEKNHPEKFLVIFENVESNKTQQSFFKQLFGLLIEHLGKRKLWKQFGTWLKTKGIGEVSVDGTAKITNKELDYKEELLLLIGELGDQEFTVVMLLDEFPDVVKSIHTNEGAAMAVDTLHTLRAIRQTKEFDKFKFVFAGSVGLRHVVSSIDREKLINDLEPLHVTQLTSEEALILIVQLTKDATMIVSEEVAKNIISKIKYLLPYFIQLMIEKCNRLVRQEKRPELTNEDVEKAFWEVVKDGRNFEDWVDRFNEYFTTADAQFAIGLLTEIAHNEGYSIQQAYNYAQSVVPEMTFMKLIDSVLINDGYIVQEGNQLYFLSPFLREWWKRRYPKF